MKKIIIIIVILVVLIGAGIFLLTRRGPVLVPETPFGEKETAPGKIGEEVPALPAPVDPVAQLKSRLTLEARSFISRWASYSRDSGYANLKELLPKMSQNLKKKAEDLISKGLDVKEFYGLTTKVISIDLDESTDEKVSFSAQVQQQETKGGATNILYKRAEIIFIKEAGEWKVNEISIH